VRILLFDNHDSFTWNLSHEMERVDDSVVVEVKTAEEISLNDIDVYDAVVLSPGPGMPSDAKMLSEVLDESLRCDKPVLGICLGLQAIVEYFGGKLENLEEVLHGRVTEMVWESEGEPHGIFKGINFPCQVGHYHSWIALREGFPESLMIEASNKQGLVMAVRHRTLPVSGLQFHPESILTPDGRFMLKAWLESLK